MKHIRLETQGEAVQQFFQSLAHEADESVVELNGQPVATIMPVRANANGKTQDTETWTKAKNDRRCDLIDRKYAGQELTPNEAEELARLQAEMLHVRDCLAPLPLNEARQLHQLLLEKAQREAGIA